MMEKMLTRSLKIEEKKAAEAIVKASKIKNKIYTLNLLENVKVSSINSDSSILEFHYGNDIRTDFRQNLIYPVGLVKDVYGEPAEVMIYTDNAGKILEFEIVAMGEADLKQLSWETFTITN
jgi:hypothetical protein